MRKESDKVAENFITWDYIFFFWLDKKIPRINYFSCWGNFLIGIKALGFLFVNWQSECCILITVSVCVLDSSLNAQSYFFLFKSSIPERCLYIWFGAGLADKRKMWYNWQGIVMHHGSLSFVFVYLQAGSKFFFFCYNIFYFCS